MMLFSTSHVLFLSAFLALRIQRPDADRPFKLPGGLSTACACSALPFATCVAAVACNARSVAHASAFGLTIFVGVGCQALAWLVLRCRHRLRESLSGESAYGLHRDGGIRNPARV